MATRVFTESGPWRIEHHHIVANVAIVEPFQEVSGVLTLGIDREPGRFGQPSQGLDGFRITIGRPHPLGEASQCARKVADPRIELKNTLSFGVSGSSDVLDQGHVALRLRLRKSEWTDAQRRQTRLSIDIQAPLTHDPCVSPPTKLDADQRPTEHPLQSFQALGFGFDTGQAEYTPRAIRDAERLPSGWQKIGDSSQSLQRLVEGRLEDQATVCVDDGVGSFADKSEHEVSICWSGVVHANTSSIANRCSRKRQMNE